MEDEIFTEESLFLRVCKEYIDRIDYLGIAHIFAEFNDFTLAELKSLWKNSSNLDYIRFAKSSLGDYLLESDALRKDNYWINRTRSELRTSFNASLVAQNQARFYYLLKLAFVIAFYQRLYARYESQPLDIKELEDIRILKNGIYFRGQSNYKFRVSPSIIRNLNESVYLDDDYYYKVLKDEIGLEDKFNTLIRKDNLWMNRYNKYAFMQHSCSYSPLVDFTKNPIIATSFALSNASRINDFRNEDSAVFCLNNAREKIGVIHGRYAARNFLVNQFYLKVINADSIKLGEIYPIKKADDSVEVLQFESIDVLLDALTPEIKIIDIPTNDRMLYQSGVFVCFYGCVCLRDFVAYELNPAFVLKKIRIPSKDKKRILSSIYANHREYDPEHLMDPYLYFTE